MAKRDALDHAGMKLDSHMAMSIGLGGGLAIKEILGNLSAPLTDNSVIGDGILHIVIAKGKNCVGEG